MTKVEKIKKFAKDYSFELIILGAGVVGGVVGYKIKDRQIEKIFERTIKNYPFGTEHRF